MNENHKSRVSEYTNPAPLFAKNDLDSAASSALSPARSQPGHDPENCFTTPSPPTVSPFSEASQEFVSAPEEPISPFLQPQEPLTAGEGTGPEPTHLWLNPITSEDFSHTNERSNAVEGLSDTILSALMASGSQKPKSGSQASKPKPVPSQSEVSAASPQSADAVATARASVSSPMTTSATGATPASKPGKPPAKLTPQKRRLDDSDDDDLPLSRAAKPPVARVRSQSCQVSKEVGDGAAAAAPSTPAQATPTPIYNLPPSCGFSPGFFEQLKSVTDNERRFHYEEKAIINEREDIKKRRDELDAQDEKAAEKLKKVQENRKKFVEFKEYAEKRADELANLGKNE